MIATATKELTLHLPAELVERILETASRRGQQPDEVVAEILGVSLPPRRENVMPSAPPQVITAETIAQELMAQGLRADQIVMPGGAKDIITYIADDFDAPLDDFKDKERYNVLKEGTSMVKKNRAIKLPAADAPEMSEAEYLAVNGVELNQEPKGKRTNLKPADCKVTHAVRINPALIEKKC